jgi:hypothetical protein
MYSAGIQIVLTAAALFIAAAGCGGRHADDRGYLLGMHTFAQSDDEGQQLLASMPALSSRGINAIIVEVDYYFAWVSHDELLTPDALSFETARGISRKGRELGIRIIPHIECLGHQSYDEENSPLLQKHPDFDETPGKYPGNVFEDGSILYRSWCPLNSDVNALVFDLADQLIDAFEADAFSVGMDEVVLIGSEYCSRCRGKNPAELFAKAVNDLHEHLVTEKGVEMFMWGDRLLDADSPDTGYGVWESSLNGTAGAIDLIPNDIVICDWHYSSRQEYKSIPLFIEKGFRVWPTSYNDSGAVNALISYSLRYADSPAMAGHLYTHWKETGNGKLADWLPMVQTIGRFRSFSASSDTVVFHSASGMPFDGDDDAGANRLRGVGCEWNQTGERSIQSIRIPTHD